MTLDQLVTFTLPDDHEAQERVWFDGASGDHHPQTLRRMLTRSLVEGSDRRARFIGAEAYEAAGTPVLVTHSFQRYSAIQDLEEVSGYEFRPRGLNRAYRIFRPAEFSVK